MVDVEKPAALLLDSHAFLWMLSDDGRLGPRVRDAIMDPDTVAWLSAATVWELGIKVAIGRLHLNVSLRDLVRRAVAEGGLRVLDVTPDHALRAAELPTHHRDPFDRMLIAQARAEGLTLATCDARILEYDLATLW